MLTVMIFPLSVYANRQPSVVMLEFPAGAENTGLAESGVSLSNSINTMFWNPAALPAVYDNLQTRIQAGYFSEHPLNIKEVDHTYTTGALFFNGLLPDIDIAYGFYKNSLNKDIQNVFSNCIGVRVLKMFSLGISLKTFSCHYVGFSPDNLGIINYKPRGFALDLGARFEHTARIASTPLTIQPQMGISLVNLGKDSAYEKHSVRKMLVPRGFFIGSSVTTKLLEFCSYTMTAQARASLLQYASSDSDFVSGYHYDGGHDLLVSLSNKFQITPFYSYGFGYLVDYNYRRFEFHDVHTFTLDARKAMAIIYRIKNRDFEPESQNIQKFQEKLSFYKGKIKPNLRFSYSTADINSIDGNSRDGQKGIDFSLGF
jgi:hypothetical protein